MLKFLSVITYIDENGNEKRIDLQTSSIENTVPLRASNGLFKVGDPNSSLDAVNKNYLQNNFLSYTIDQTSISSSSREALRNAIGAAETLPPSGENYVLKDSSDYLINPLSIYINNPSGSEDIVNKKYVNDRAGSLDDRISKFYTFKEDSSDDSKYVSSFDSSTNGSAVILRKPFSDTVVLTSGVDQEIGGVKTFGGTLRANNAPVSSYDVINKHYIDDLLYSMADGTLMKMTVNGQTPSTTYINNVSLFGGDVIVDWGDGNREVCTILQTNITHQYASTGDKNIYIMRANNINDGTYSIYQVSGLFGNTTATNVLKSIIVPESITSIGTSAFYNCNNLKTVKFNGKVTRVGSHSFYYTAIEFIDLSYVQTISAGAFDRCSSLKSLVLGKSVSRIEQQAFYRCSSLATLYYGGESSSDWNAIDLSNTDNSKLIQANRYYYSKTQPSSIGNYWHWVNGVPTPWTT